MVKALIVHIGYKRFRLANAEDVGTLLAIAERAVEMESIYSDGNKWFPASTPEPLITTIEWGELREDAGGTTAEPIEAAPPAIDPAEVPF